MSMQTEIALVVQRALNEVALFEINDAITRGRVRDYIDIELSSFQRDRLIREFFTICDERNNPYEYVRDGHLQVQVTYVEPWGEQMTVEATIHGIVCYKSMSMINGHPTPAPAPQSGGFGHGGYGATTISSSAGINGIYASNVPSNVMQGVAKGLTTGLTMIEPQSDSAVLPKLKFESLDENCHTIFLTLEPEHGISSADTLKLVMMIHSHSTDPRAFSVYNFVKANNLERHFRFSR